MMTYDYLPANGVTFKVLETNRATRAEEISRHIQMRIILLLRIVSRLEFAILVRWDQQIDIL